MAWSFRIARVSGIDVRVHVTFLLAVLLGALDFGSRFGAPGFVFGALLVSAVFLCVVLHELGHSLVAQGFGLPVDEIVLLPIGGVARLRREPEKPMHELLIAIAGPLVNVLIAFVLFVALGVVTGSFSGGGAESWFAVELTPLGLLRLLLISNVSLAVFNMIPALPMDGGRVLRAGLALLIGQAWATRIAGRLAQVLALGLLYLAIFELKNPILAVVSAVVFFAAGRERQAAMATDQLQKLCAGEVCDPDAPALSTSDSLAMAFDRLVRSPQAAFGVFYGSQFVGAVTRSDLMRAEATAPARTLGMVMRRALPYVPSTATLAQVRSVLLEHPGPAVVQGQHGVVGLLTLEDLDRMARVMSELEKRGIRRAS
jgi:Zn-dependent protease/predicted transcriptional regulator